LSEINQKPNEISKDFKEINKEETFPYEKSQDNKHQLFKAYDLPLSTEQFRSPQFLGLLFNFLAPSSFAE
jgi:hypothetical protein